MIAVGIVGIKLDALGVVGDSFVECPRYAIQTASDIEIMRFILVQRDRVVDVQKRFIGETEFLIKKCPVFVTGMILRIMGETIGPINKGSFVVAQLFIDLGSFIVDPGFSRFQFNGPGKM